MTQEHQHMTRADILWMIVLGGLWGSSFLFMKIASPQFGPVALIEMRVLVAAIFLSMFVSWEKGLSLFRRKPVAIVVVGIINSAIPFSLFAFAALSLPAGFSAVLNATAPFFGAIVAFLWLRQKLASIKVLGLVIGFTGVVILVWNKLSVPGSELGVAAGLLAAMLYGIAAHFTKRYLAGEDSLSIATGSLLSASLFLIPCVLAYWAYTAPQLPNWQGWFAASALGIGCTGVAYAIFFRLLQRIGPTQATTVAYLIPIFGVIWGAVFLSEPITANMVLGGIVILVGLWIVS